MSLPKLNINEINTKFDENKEQYNSLLRKQYEDYTLNISTKSMAASLTCCSYFIHLIEMLKPTSVIDFGSGFSSFAIRNYKKITGVNFKTFSVDSDSEWLEKSRLFCFNNHVLTENFYTWKHTPREPFDLIFFDIDMTKKRLNYFKPLFNDFCHDGTVILFDDMHKPILKNKLAEEIKKVRCSFYDIEHIIKEGKRFSYLIQLEE